LYTEFDKQLQSKSLSVDNLLLLLCSSDSHCSELQDSNMYDTMMSQFICSGHSAAKNKKFSSRKWTAMCWSYPACQGCYISDDWI